MSKKLLDKLFMLSPHVFVGSIFGVCALIVMLTMIFPKTMIWFIIAILGLMMTGIVTWLLTVVYKGFVELFEHEKERRSRK